MKHILLAEQMAEWLKTAHFSWLGKVEKIDPQTFQKKLENKTGIIFFKDYWQRGNENFETRSGDHIDLWKENRISGSSMFVRGVLEFFGRVSDLNASHEVWFWEVK